MAEEIGFENGRNSNFQGLVTLTLTLDPVIRRTVVHHSSTSTYIPNLLKSKKLFVDGRTDGRTDGHSPPPVILLGRLLEVDLKMKKHSRETQTLRAGCSKAEPKIFTPPQTPFLGVRYAKIKWAGDGHYLNLQTQLDEDRCTQFRVIVVTDPQTQKLPSHTNKPTDRTDYNTLHRS